LSSLFGTSRTSAHFRFSQIYDLLDNSSTGPASSSTHTHSSNHHASSSQISGSISQLHRSSSLYPDHLSSNSMGGGFGSSGSLVGMGAGGVKRKALTLKNDIDASGKYVAGLREIRVRTREVSRSMSSRVEEDRRLRLGIRGGRMLIVRSVKI
jgi:hypothetical protein